MLPQHAFHTLRSAPWTAPVGAARTDLASAPSPQAFARQTVRTGEVARDSWERVFAAAQAAVQHRSVEMSERPL